MEYQVDNNRLALPPSQEWLAVFQSTPPVNSLSGVLRSIRHPNHNPRRKRNRSSAMVSSNNSTPRALFSTGCGSWDTTLVCSNNKNMSKKSTMQIQQSPLYSHQAESRLLQISDDEIEVIENWKPVENQQQRVYGMRKRKQQHQQQKGGADTAELLPSPTLLTSASSFCSSTTSSTTSSSRRSSLKGLQQQQRNQASHRDSAHKTVAFDTVEIREHPRILGDNPSVKRGPALGIDWFVPLQCKVHHYTVDEFEKRKEKQRRRNNKKNKKSPHGATVVPSKLRKKMLALAGVSPEEIAQAKLQVHFIQRSRHYSQHQLDCEFQTRIMWETCWQTMMFLDQKVAHLMEQARRAQQEQQRRQQQLI